MTFIFISDQAVNSPLELRSTYFHDIFGTHDAKIYPSYIRIYETTGFFNDVVKVAFLPTLSIEVSNIHTLVELIKNSKGKGRFELK